MSVRTTPPLPNAPPVKTRLEEVLAAGCVRFASVDIGLRSSQSALINRKRGLGNKTKGPELGGVKKEPSIAPQPKVNLEALRSLASLQDFETALLEEAFETVDANITMLGTDDAATLASSVAMVQVLRRVDIITNDDFVTQYPAAVETLLFYMHGADDEERAATGVNRKNVFRDTTRGQKAQYRFQDASMSTLLLDYVKDTANIFGQVWNGNFVDAALSVATLTETVKQLFPSLLKMIPGGSTINSLDTIYSLVGYLDPTVVAGQVMDAWDGVDSTSRLVDATLSWRETQQQFGDYVNAIPYALGYGIPSNYAEGVVRQLWKADKLLMPTPARLAAYIALILVRAVYKVAVYKVDSVVQFVKKNTPKVAEKWGNQLGETVRGYAMARLVPVRNPVPKPGVEALNRLLPPDQDSWPLPRLAEIDQAYIQWTEVHPKLNKLVRNKPTYTKKDIRTYAGLLATGESFLSRIPVLGTQVAGGIEALRIGGYMLQYRSWQNGIATDLPILDEAVGTLRDIEDKFLLSGVRIIRNPAAARGLFGGADNNNDDDPFAGLGPLVPQ